MLFVQRTVTTNDGLLLWAVCLLNCVQQMLYRDILDYMALPSDVCEAVIVCLLQVQHVPGIRPGLSEVFFQRTNIY